MVLCGFDVVYDGIVVLDGFQKDGILDANCVLMWFMIISTKLWFEFCFKTTYVNHVQHQPSVFRGTQFRPVPIFRSDFEISMILCLKTDKIEH